MLANKSSYGNCKNPALILVRARRTRLECDMVEIHNTGGDGKVILLGPACETLEVKIVSGEQSRSLTGWTKTRVEKMRNRANNAANGFPKDMPDGTVLYQKGPTRLSLGIEKTGVGESRPSGIIFGVDGDSASYLKIDADTDFLQQLVEALGSYLG